jgi:hypothetical protein
VFGCARTLAPNLGVFPLPVTARRKSDMHTNAPSELPVQSLDEARMKRAAWAESNQRTVETSSLEFLAHRNVHRSEDETANPTIEGTS